MSRPACHIARLVDRHFGLRIRPAEERTLRQHLGTCEQCRAYYERHLALAAADPRAADAEQRLAIGLGLRRRRPGTGLAVAAAATAVAVIAIIAVRSRDVTPPPAFAARGASANRLFVYRVPPGGPPTTSEVVARDEELAFAYENATGRRYLVVFGVDEHGHVYWFHPAWPDAQRTPTAVPATTAPGIHELPEAVGHAYDGERLHVHAAFTDEPLSVREVEQRIADRQPGDPMPGVAPGDQVVVELRVTR